MAKLVEVARGQRNQRTRQLLRKTNGVRHPDRLRVASQERIAISVAARNELVHDMAAVGLLPALNDGCKVGHDLRSMLGMVLDTAIAVTHADFGNIQLLDPATGGLRIYVQRGFSVQFLRFFDRVSCSKTASSAAMRNLKRVVVEDVAHSPIFSESRILEAILAEGVRAVQSTPLLTSGDLMGMLSTHYRMPRKFSVRELARINVVAGSAQHLIERWARNRARCNPEKDQIWSLRDRRGGRHVRPPRTGASGATWVGWVK